MKKMKAKACKIYLRPRRRSLHVAKQTQRLSMELSKRYICTRSDYPWYYWPDGRMNGVTANSRGGPFLVSDSDGHIFQAKKEEFVQHFIEKICPNSSFRKPDLQYCLKDRDPSGRQRACRQFICNSLARHLSWVSSLSRGSKVISPNHNTLYQQFINKSIRYLRKYPQKSNMSDLLHLIELENDLARASFRAWSSLFDIIIFNNDNLIKEIDRLIPDFDIFQKTPCMIPWNVVPTWKKNIKRLQHCVLHNLANSWIYLGDQLSELPPDDARRTTYTDLQATAVDRWLEGCIAINSMTLKVVHDILEDVAYPDPESEEKIPSEKWQSELVLGLRSGWADVQIFLESIGESSSVCNNHPRWATVRDLDSKREEILEVFEMLQATDEDYDASSSEIED